MHSCKISTTTRLRSLPPSLAFSLSCTHASHALPLTQACPSPEAPQAHTDRRQHSRWASNAESWCRGGHRQFACVSEVTTWAWLLLQVELMTRRARSRRARDGRRDSACSGHHATRRGATSWCRGGASTFCMQAGHRSRRGRGCYFCMHLRCNDVGQGRDSAAGRLSESTAFVPLGLNWQLERG